MTAFLAGLLRLSLLGSFLAALLFLLKPLMRGRVSRSVQYYLWLLVLLRLCIPAGLTVPLPRAESPAPVVQTAPAAEPIQTTAPVPPAEPTQTASAAPAGTALPASAPVERTGTLLFALWAAGAALTAGWYLLGYGHIRRRVLASARPVPAETAALAKALEPVGQAQVLESDGVDAPLLLGVLRPVIVLPARPMTADRLRDVLRHELTHVRRWDLLFKWFAAFAASVHWFNPLLFFVRREIGRACELACDEAVLQTLDEGGRRHYGETLLALALPPRPAPLAVAMCEEKRNLQERLVSIVKIRKRTPLTILLTLALVAAVGGCSLVGNAQAAEPDDGNIPFNAFYLPRTGVKLRVDMPRKELEQQLGEGIPWYAPKPGLAEDRSILYETEDGLFLVHYAGYKQNDRVHTISCLSEESYRRERNGLDTLTPEAAAAYAQAGPQRVQAAEGIAIGTSLDQLVASLPQPYRLTQSLSGDPVQAPMVYEAYDEASSSALTCYLSEETAGIYKISLEYSTDPINQTECLIHNGDLGFFPGVGSMATPESELGPAQRQGDAYLYGSGDDVLTVTYDYDGMAIRSMETQSHRSVWCTSRGVGCGDTLEDLEARYDGDIQTDAQGRYFLAQGPEFDLTFRLDETDTVTALRLAWRGEWTP